MDRALAITEPVFSGGLTCERSTRTLEDGSCEGAWGSEKAQREGPGEGLLRE